MDLNDCAQRKGRRKIRQQEHCYCEADGKVTKVQNRAYDFFRGIYVMGDKHCGCSIHRLFAWMKACVCLTLLTFIFLKPDVQAAGLWLYEGSVPDMGMANAGAPLRPLMPRPLAATPQA